jgi:hypothetical protein
MGVGEKATFYLQSTLYHRDCFVTTGPTDPLRRSAPSTLLGPPSSVAGAGARAQPSDVRFSVIEESYDTLLDNGNCH